MHTPDMWRRNINFTNVEKRSEQTPGMVRLSALPAGSQGHLRKIDDPFIQVRLHSLGIREGQLIHVETRTLGGSSMILRSGDMSLAIRSSEAANLWIEKTGA